MLLAIGSNSAGQLGVGHCNDLTSLEPVLLQTPISLKQIACGGNHTLFLLADGTVFGCGSTDAGQLGLRSDYPHEVSDPSHPRIVRIGLDDKIPCITQVSATWKASHFLTDSGTILACGHGAAGELGLGHGVIHASTPQPILDFPPAGSAITLMCASMGHTIVVLDNGNVYGWGMGRQGQLGSPDVDVWRPRKVCISQDMSTVAAACGKDFTCLIGQRERGDVFLCGPNKRDRFRIKANAPKQIPRWKSICAAWGTVYVVDVHGKLTAWGRNDHGQLSPAVQTSIRSIVAGSEHCLALTHDDDVVAWGWNEHGNCGSPLDSNGATKEGWNTVARGLNDVALFAGCATSFILTKGRGSDLSTNDRKRKVSTPAIQSNNP